MQKLKNKAYANSPFELGTMRDSAYRAGIDEMAELCELEFKREYKKSEEVEPLMLRIKETCILALASLIMTAGLFAVVSVFGPKAHAQEIPADSAIRAIIGEDSSSYKGMYAVACAIRNRVRNKGTLKGVYGLRAGYWVGDDLLSLSGSKHLVRRLKHGKTEPISAELYQKASKAWHESETGPDVTHGASHWEGAKLKRPYWVGDFKRSVVVGGNRFYYN